MNSLCRLSASSHSSYNSSGTCNDVPARIETVEIGSTCIRVYDYITTLIGEQRRSRLCEERVWTLANGYDNCIDVYGVLGSLDWNQARPLASGSPS